MDATPETLKTDLHIKFLRRFLKHAPKSLTPFESTRPTILFFIISGLDMLNALDTVSPEEKAALCDWIYSLQIEPKPGCENDIDELRKCGFYGSHTLIFKGCEDENVSEYNVGHLAMTYSCLITLLILGDDLGRVNKTAILKSVKYLQNKDGSFLSSIVCGENDMRFTYCAVVICFILNDFSEIDADACVEFICKSIHYDGGISLEPNLESHGGSSFCGIAALSLLGYLNMALPWKKKRRLQKWLIFRQQSGFQGRPNKEVDTCYSFWIGATLTILNSFSLVNWEENRKSILECQNTCVGGFSKHHYTDVDILHTYFGLYGLSLMNEPGLQRMHPALNMSSTAYLHLKKLHRLDANMYLYKPAPHEPLHR